MSPEHLALFLVNTLFEPVAVAAGVAWSFGMALIVVRAFSGRADRES